MLILGLPSSAEYINSKFLRTQNECVISSRDGNTVPVYEHLLNLNEGNSFLSTSQLRRFCRNRMEKSLTF